jgi:hypothetical protein
MGPLKKEYFSEVLLFLIIRIVKFHILIDLAKLDQYQGQPCH